MRTRAILTAVCCAMLTRGGGVAGNELLKLQISPLVAPAPGCISVRTFIDASDDNRELQVDAQSPDVLRSSAIELAGKSAPKVAVFDFTNLPAGRYEVSAVLIGTSGVRATTTRTVLVVAGPGSRK